MTRVQQETLQLIEGYIDQHNIAPTIRELASLRGVRTTSSVKRTLTSLAAEGYIIRTSGWRGIKLTNRTEATKLAFRACRLLAVAETQDEVKAACVAAIEAIELHDTGCRA